MKTYLIGFLLAFTFFSTSAQTPATTIPDFQLYKADGIAFNKMQITPGKKTLIMFFDATCSHCQNTMKQLSKRYAELEKINIYLVSLDKHITMNYFMSQYGKNLIGKKNVLLLEDKDHIFIPLFLPSKYPALYLYSPKNQLIFNTSGDENLQKLFDSIKK